MLYKTAEDVLRQKIELAAREFHIQETVVLVGKSSLLSKDLRTHRQLASCDAMKCFSVLSMERFHSSFTACHCRR